MKISNNLFTKPNIKVREHCHITGVFRGTACNDCNLKLKLTDKIPVVFYNLRRYDSHLLRQELGKFKKEIYVIPNNMEKYIYPFHSLKKLSIIIRMGEKRRK